MAAGVRAVVGVVRATAGVVREVVGVEAAAAACGRV